MENKSGNSTVNKVNPSDVSGNDPSGTKSPVSNEYPMDFVTCPENLPDGDLHVDLMSMNLKVSIIKLLIPIL